ncbi:MAG: hypothetical protein IJ449_13260 [Clostridia bacterium]|nr:hypothetical protein [Clostridia bacterium]
MNDKLKKFSHSDENGLVVVEAVISFTAFIMLCIGIAFLINIFTLHNKIQYAINETAHEIASYSYLYDAFGLRTASDTIKKDGKKYVDTIDDTSDQVTDTLTKMQELYGEINNTTTAVKESELSESSVTALKSQLESLKNAGTSTYESGKASVEALKTAFSDPKGLIIGFVYLGADLLAYEAKSLVAEAMAGAMTEKYLSVGDLDVDAYLKKFGIDDGYDGLDFSGSSIFCDDADDERIIDIVVEYDIDLSFISYILPESTYHVVQRVSVGAWAGGDCQVVNVGIPEDK